MSKKQKLSKEEVRGPDAFVATSDRVGQWIEKHKVLVFSVLGSFLVIGGVGVSWKQFSSYREKRAQKALYQIEAQIEKRQEEISKEMAEIKAQVKGQNKNKKSTKSIAEPKRDLEADFGPLLGEYGEKIKEFKGSKASLIGAIRLAALYMDYKSFERARELLADIVNEASKTGILFGLIHMQNGTALIAIEKHKEARAEFQMVLDDSGSSFLHAEAVLKLGLVEEKLNNLEKAREHYTRASQEFPVTEAGRTAKTYLRLMKLGKRAVGL